MPEIKYDSNEWPLRVIKAKEAWALPLLNSESKRMGEGIIIAHPDTGWTGHPELLKGGRLIRDKNIAKNFFGNEKKLSAEDLMTGPSASHGTTTAGLMLSEEGHPRHDQLNNDYPSISINYTEKMNHYVTGIAPRVKVIPLRVTDFVFLGSNHVTRQKAFVDTYGTLTKAIYYALKLNKDKDIKDKVGVISISLGGFKKKDYLEQALIKARQLGVVVCAAAGQDKEIFRKIFKNLDRLLDEVVSPTVPGQSHHTICVAGCTDDFSKPTEGYYGNQVDITAPGWGIDVARTVGDPRLFNGPNPTRKFTIELASDGTSYSAALTAGACALWQAYHGRMNLIRTYGRPFILDVFRYCLANSVHKPRDWDSMNRGMGVLNVKALLKVELPTVAMAEIVANSNHWDKTKWGDPTEWGRVA